MAWFERPRPNTGTEGDVIARRVVAILVDLILIGVITSIVGGALGPGRATGVVGLLITFGYYIYLEGTYGRTLGKMALGLVVVTEGGGPVDYEAAAIRTLLRLVDVLPVFYLVGFVVMLLTDRTQRVGDIVADTVVVRAA